MYLGRSMPPSVVSSLILIRGRLDPQKAKNRENRLKKKGLLHGGGAYKALMKANHCQITVGGLLGIGWFRKEKPVLSEGRILNPKYVPKTHMAMACRPT